MSERLIIDNFAGLKHVEIDLKKINVFIGPQATGKSVTAKLAYFFKTLPLRMLDVLADEGDEDMFWYKQRNRFCTFFPPSSLGKKGFRIQFSCGHAYATVKQREGHLSTAFSPAYSQLFRSMEKQLRPKRTSRPSVETASLPNIFTVLRDAAKALYLPNSFCFNQMFIPAGRSFFASLRPWRMLLDRSEEEGPPIDPFLAEFGVIYDRHKRLNPRDTQGGKSELLEMAQGIVGGRYARLGKWEMLRMADGRVVNLAYASSGQQEALPLTIVLPRIARVGTLLQGRSIFIEEPEAHIFPTAQKQMVELIAAVSNTTRQPHQFVLTTHSPYVLTALNNLIQAGSIALKAAKSPKELHALYALVPKTHVVPPKDVAAYYFDKGGAESIIDEEGLIRFDQIDSVSEDISIQFGKLLDIEVRR